MSPANFLALSGFLAGVQDSSFGARHCSARENPSFRGISPIQSLVIPVQMADLDDFFAKKDRKKSKGNKKFTTTEEVAKKLEDSAKKPEKTVQKKERAPEGEDGATQSHVSYNKKKETKPRKWLMRGR